MRMRMRMGILASTDVLLPIDEIGGRDCIYFLHCGEVEILIHLDFNI